MKKLFIILFLFFYISNQTATAKPKNTYFYEKDYQNAWCSLHHGTQEVVLSDKARIDCLTQTHAVEFDFAKKWAESIGQALYYAQATNKKAGIVLIIEDIQKDQKYLDRVKTVASLYNITLWTIFPKDVSDFKKLVTANK